MQRLPPLNIEGAKEPGKVLREKYPGTTYLCPWNLAGFGPAAQFLGVYPQELRSFPEPHSAHDRQPPSEALRYACAAGVARGGSAGVPETLRSVPYRRPFSWAFSIRASSGFSPVAISRVSR